MNIFKKNQEALTSENKNLITEVERLEAELEKAKSFGVDLSEQLATVEALEVITLQESLTASESLVAELETKASLLEDELAKDKETAANAIADFDGTVASEVAKQVADLGLEEGLDDDNEVQEIASATWAKMPEGNAKREFFAENKSAILQETVLKNSL